MNTLPPMREPWHGHGHGKRIRAFLILFVCWIAWGVYAYSMTGRWSEYTRYSQALGYWCLVGAAFIAARRVQVGRNFSALLGFFGYWFGVSILATIIAQATSVPVFGAFISLVMAAIIGLVYFPTRDTEPVRLVCAACGYTQSTIRKNCKHCKTPLLQIIAKVA